MARSFIPFDPAWMPDEQPATLADVVLTDELVDYARRRWPDKSDAMRSFQVRRSVWQRFETAKPHPDDPGRRAFGGAQPRSGPSKEKRAIGRAIVEHFEGRQKEVLDAIGAPLGPDSGATPMERHRAGMAIATHAREESKEQREADAFARLTDDEIRLAAAKEFVGMLRAGDVTLEQLERMLSGEPETTSTSAEDYVDADEVYEEAQLTP